ncbi:short transient receptor potential channel 7-like [Mytilus trossulus]|uniref:short transient receptor potential channel 7-like n=1 Tax=Mytilus trossulus TaxID=6551 RepID=UPI003004AE92
MMEKYNKDDKNKVKVLAERLQPGLNENERQLLSASELGDEEIVKQLIDRSEASAEVLDFQGRSALDLAIIAEDEGLTSYLIRKVSDKLIHQGLLCAVEQQRTQICELLLKNSIYDLTSSERQASEQLNLISITNGTTNNVHPKNTKSKVRIMLKEALMRASIKNNFQIVQIIMLKGICLEIPHDYFCSCKHCIGDRHNDYLGFCNRRLDTFRALASPAYISLTEEDPVLACFQLSKKFRHQKQIETEYQQIYDELGNQCEQFTLDLLDECRSSEEVKVLLSSSVKSKIETNTEKPYSSESFPLLLTAMQMEQKQFVAHEKCQAQVSEKWFKGLQAMRYLNRFQYLLLSIPIGMVLLPILSVVYIVAPWSKVTVLLNTPSTRFLSYTCSYLSFLFLTVVAKLHYSDMWISLACDNTPTSAYILITLIFVWILGWIWEEMKQVWSSGIEDYAGSVWNIIDSLMLMFLLASFTLDIVVPIKVADAFTTNPLPLNVTGEQVNLSTLLHCYVTAEVDEVDVCPSVSYSVGVSWEPSWIPDPELISDILFSFGIILSISRISFIMPANETFGTILVSFYRTFTDLMKLCGMFLLILLAFSCGLAALYAAHRCQTTTFKGFRATLFMLVWSLFGFGPGEAPELNKDAPMSSLTNNPSRNVYTENLGYLLYGTYVFAALIVLMNLLIAVMSVTFEEVQDKRDVEWKFMRTELWLSFIEPGCPVAPPFNIIPTPKTIMKFVCCIKSFICRCGCKTELKRTSMFKKKTDDPCNVRKVVICSLVRRYILHAEREKVEDDDDATEDKLRRLIELVASKIEGRLDDIENRLNTVDTSIGDVNKGANEIFTLQKTDMGLTEKLIEAQEIYKKLMHKNWEENTMFYERKLEEINEMKDEKLRLVALGKMTEAERINDEMLAKLMTEFVPKTTLK